MISVIIPVYKNYEMFFRNLKNNKKYFADCEVVVMNDFPQEKIANKVKQIIPEAITIDNEINLGFGSNVNTGVKKASGEFILLLNSDVILKDDSFKKSLEEFKKDRNIFATSFAQYESDGKLVGANRGYFKDGLIYHDRQLISDNRQPITNFWAEGGSSILRKDLFLKLHGFDPLYDPFYWEDIDLSYRAWKSGYKIYYFPQVKVQHFHESTIGKFFQKSSILKTAYRNQFIFNWKNLTDRDLFFKHLLFLPILLIRSMLTGNLILLQGFFLGIVLLPKIIESRKKAVKSFIKTDEEILSIFNRE